MIYVAADSHRYVFENSPFFIRKEIGAATAHNINNKSKSTNNSYLRLMEIVNLMDKEKDTLIIVCGEIDCRFHIYYQYKKRGEKQTIAEIIDETFFNYGEVMKQLQDQKIKFVISSTTPCGWTYEPYLTLVGATDYMPNFIKRFGPMPTPEQYIEIYQLFNDKLKAYCNSKGYLYLDIYNKFIALDRHLQKEYALDLQHLNLKAQPIIIEMLKEMKIL
jgi:hypothetical protein